MLLLGENPRQTLPVSSSTPMTGVNSGERESTRGEEAAGGRERTADDGGVPILR
ncbi:hypothetical protein HanHA89_Chr16g0640281 [Helianthus annuus]|nr:hypothetical protein HanHA89_Chr16g0640281 [Helianthus annuus]